MRDNALGLDSARYSENQRDAARYSEIQRDNARQSLGLDRDTNMSSMFAIFKIHFFLLSVYF